MTASGKDRAILARTLGGEGHAGAEARWLRLLQDAFLAGGCVSHRLHWLALNVCLAYGALLVLTVAPLYMWVLPRGSVSLRKNDGLYDESLSIDRRVYWLLTTIFALGAVIMTAISVQLFGADAELTQWPRCR